MNVPKPEMGRVVYWDTTQPGFGLRVTSTGHKSYIVQYRAGGGGRMGTDRKATIAGTLSLADARKEAKKVAGDVAKGVTRWRSVASNRKPPAAPSRRCSKNTSLANAA